MLTFILQLLYVAALFSIFNVCCMRQRNNVQREPRNDLKETENEARRKRKSTTTKT